MPCAGHEDGDGAELGADPCEGRLDRLPVGDVDFDGQRPSPRGLELRRRRLGAVAVLIEDGDVVAVRRELAGRRPARCPTRRR